MGFFVALIVGGIVGWLAGIALPNEQRRKRFDLPLGMIGGLLGGFGLGPLLGGGNLFEAAFYPMTIVVALLGAMIVLAIVNMFRRGRSR
jgi:uncharacterized membrane protein YeaQ/YmgE (transglycosylase-associated protein family)